MTEYINGQQIVTPSTNYGPFWENLQVPQGSTFTWRNKAATTSYVQHRNGLLVHETAVQPSEAFRMLTKPLGPPPWTVTVGVMPGLQWTQIHHCGLVVRKQGAGADQNRIVTVRLINLGSQFNLSYGRMNSPTSWNGNYAEVATSLPGQGPANMIRFRDDGVNRLAQYSTDGGKSWNNFHVSAPSSDWVVPDEAGLLIGNNTGTPATTHAFFFHFSITA